ncbi:MAG: hypothetical protein WBX20_18130, partial [Terrimicrobiaceae bacterium]
DFNADHREISRIMTNEARFLPEFSDAIAVRQQRLRRDASEVADRFSDALRLLCSDGCVARDAPPARALRHRLPNGSSG